MPAYSNNNLEDYNLLSVVLRLVRVFVPMILEISLLEFPVRRFRRAECEKFKGVCSFTVIVEIIASMLVRTSGPRYQLVPISTLSNLTLANMVRYWGWHGRVIRCAHDVLADAIQTMVDVVEIERLVLAVMF